MIVANWNIGGGSSMVARITKRPSDLSNLQRLVLAKHFIDTNFSKSVSLADLADVACLSKHHFKRLFKLHFKTTPHQMLIQCRIDLAKGLLEDSNMSVNEITIAVGFEDTSSFIRLFRSKVGMTPLAYRNLHVFRK